MTLAAPVPLSPSWWPWQQPARLACMDAGELQRWDEANERCPWPDHMASPCRDCTAAFAAEMRFEGRCSGRPGSDVVPLELATLRQ